MENKIKEILSLVLGIDQNLIHDDSMSSDFKQWDSVKHINIVLVLEEEFKIKFTPEEMAELISVKLINHVVKEKLS
jgi:acyl carrier protein